MSTASVLMAGTGTNTSRIPYSSMSVLEIFYDYCVSGVDFSLPGNGGKDCAAILSNGRRVVESVVALTAGTGFVWLGARWHAAPRRSVRPPISAHPAERSKRSDDDPHRYEPVRILLLVAMTFALALEACYKVATRQLVFIVNPCHLLCVIHIILLAVPAKHKSLQYLFRIHLFFLHCPIIACVLPVTNTLFLPFEVATYWIEHVLLLIVPVYLLRSGGQYSVEKLSDPSWIFMSFGVWVIYHFAFLDPIAAFTQANVNSMLCPAIADPIGGKNWRVWAYMHQFALTALSGKLWGLLGVAECEEGIDGQGDEGDDVKKE